MCNSFSLIKPSADKPCCSAVLQNEEHRVEEEEAETRVKLKAMREHHKKWEGNREKRIGSWRDFEKNKQAKKSKPLGGIKPPKLKVRSC